MAIGNTFGATALSSYGGFWIGTAIILTPGGFEIEDTLILDNGNEINFLNSFGLYLMVCGQIILKTAQDAWLTTVSGLVHLHLPAADLHSALHGCFLPPLLHP